ncbi:MAG TPA: TonB family protein [Candidatus Saccharimonadia bacterium]|nr:TonB family protein [Candidatus Saccharimonadia bacterium]
MSLLARALLALLVATASFAAPAETNLPDSLDVRADLSVSAEGKIVKLEFVEDLSPELEQFLRERVQSWSIKPARRDGRPVGGDTALYLRLSIEPAGKDVLVRVARASTGPRYATTTPPMYPAVAITRRHQALVYVTADIRADGTVSAVSSRMLAGKGSRMAFLTAAERSVLRWRFVPERVDGLPVATRVQIPMAFQLSGMPRLEMPELDAGLPLEPNALVADSEFEIATDVVGRKL